MSTRATKVLETDAVLRGTRHADSRPICISKTSELIKEAAQEGGDGVSQLK